MPTIMETIAAALVTRLLNRAVVRMGKNAAANTDEPKLPKATTKVELPRERIAPATAKIATMIRVRFWATLASRSGLMCPQISRAEDWAMTSSCVSAVETQAATRPRTPARPMALGTALRASQGITWEPEVRSGLMRRP